MRWISADSDADLIRDGPKNLGSRFRERKNQNKHCLLLLRKKQKNKAAGSVTVSSNGIELAAAAATLRHTVRVYTVDY